MTGHTEYWPLYASIGNIHNNSRRAHGLGLVLVVFLAIPKSMLLYYFSIPYQSDVLSPANKEHASCPDFRQYWRRLFHASLALILWSLLPGEKTPKVYKCPDRHFRCVVWGIGPYIADYPEQVLLACVVQGWCLKWVNILFHNVLSFTTLLPGARHVRIILIVTSPNFCILMCSPKALSKNSKRKHYGKTMA